MNWKRLTASLGQQYLGRVIGLGVSLFSVALLSRYLGVTAFGDYTAALAIAGLVVTFSDFGFFWSTVENFLRDEGKLDAVRDILGIRTLVTLALLILSVLLVTFGNFNPAVKEAFIVLTIFVFSSSVNSIIIALYQAEYKMIWPTVVDVLSRIVNLAIIVIGVKLQLGFMWFIMGASVAALVHFLINWLGLLRNNTIVWPRIRGVKWGKYYHSVVLIGLMTLFSTLFYRADIIILTWMRDAVDVGIYGMAQKISDLVTMIQGLFLAALFPLLVSRFKENNEALFNNEISRAMLLSAVIGIPITAFGLFFASDIVAIVGGAEFLTESTVTIGGHAFTTIDTTKIMFGFATLYYLSTPFTMGTLASGKMQQLIKVNVIATLVNFGLNIWLIPKFGYVTTATTTLLTEVVILILNGTYFCRLHNFSPPYGAIGRVLLATVPAFLFLLFTPELIFIVRFAVAAGIYIACVWFFVPQIRDAIRHIFHKSASGAML